VWVLRLAGFLIGTDEGRRIFWAEHTDHKVEDLKDHLVSDLHLSYPIARIVRRSIDYNTWLALRLLLLPFPSAILSVNFFGNSYRLQMMQQIHGDIATSRVIFYTLSHHPSP
jgi:predicted RNase H-related nuclease YkuK (DUF458 family)